MAVIPTFACVLRTGGDYLPEHVQVLQNQVKGYTTKPIRFVCYSDVPEIEGVEVIPLEKRHPGWWSVPEVFRNVGPTVVMGLDSVITDDIDNLFDLASASSPEDFWMIKAFNRKNKYASGIMVWNGDWSWLWKGFNYEREKNNPVGEQGYTIRALTKRQVKIGILQRRISGIYSYKHHCQREIPSDCRVILFHGKPRPFEVPGIWKMAKYGNFGEIPRLWPDSTVFILGGGPSLAKMDLHKLQGKNVLGVNQAYKLGDWVEVCYSGDSRWYTWNHRPLRRYKGMMITSYPSHFRQKPASPTLNVRRITGEGISSSDPAHIRWNGNSGASAVNVAYWLGAKRIVLIGYDMKRCGDKFNWHTDYPKTPPKDISTGRYKTNPYRKFLKCWPAIKQDAKHLGLEILNATPEGNLNLFPRVKLEDMI